MKVVYAPSARKIKGNIITNATLAYDVFACESMISAGGGANIEVLYLSHKDTDEEYNKLFLDATKSCNVKTIEFLSDALDSSYLVTDVSNIVYAYSLFCKKPSILLLLGYDNAQFGNDRLDLLLKNCVYCAYSLKELNTILTSNMNDKINTIKNFVESDIV